MYDNYAVPFFVGFLVALTAASFLTIPLSAVLFSCVVALAFLLLSRQYRFTPAAFFCVGVAFGLTRFLGSDVPRDLPKEVLGVEHSYEGVVVEEPVVSDQNAKLLVHLSDPELSVLVTTNRYPVYEYGDDIELVGKLKKPENFSDFDWVGYLDMRGVSYVMSYPNTTLISRASGSALLTTLLRFKHWSIEKIAEVLPEPAASFAAGIAFGGKGGLPKDLTESFRKTGTSHIVAVSGYNLTFVADRIDLLLRGAPLFLARFGGVLGIILFTLMTGAQGATVRAAIMALALIAARHLGRPASQFRLLMIAVFFMALQNPRILFFDLSFELSFLATVGLIFLSPLFENLIERFVSSDALRTLISGTLGAQTAVLPLILYKTGILSLVALPVNLVVLPLVPFAMILVLVTALFGAFSHLLSFAIGAVAYGVLSAILFIIEQSAALPLAFVEVGFPFSLMCFSYAFLVAWIFFAYELSKAPAVLVDGVRIELVD
ncbi:MAG: ComEC/Rec2 family competence protein [Patescibacteria group bacterium]